MKYLYLIIFVGLPAFGQSQDLFPREVVISVGCGDGLIGNPGDLVVVQETPSGGRVLGVFPKKDATDPQKKSIRINIGSSNGLMGKPGDIVISQEAPGGGIPLGHIPTNEGKFDPEKRIQLRFHRSNGLTEKVGDLAIHQPGPFGGSPLGSYPKDGGKDCKPKKLKIGLGNGIQGKKTEVVVTEVIEGRGTKLLTVLKKTSKPLQPSQNHSNEENTSVNENETSSAQ